MKNTIFSPSPSIQASFKTNLKTWLKASVASSFTLNGADVEEWRDISGNGFKGEQLTTTRKPSFFASSPINGMPAVYFDGGEYLSLDTLIADVGDLTIFIVHRPTNIASYNYILDTSGWNSLTHSSTYRFLCSTGSVSSWYDAAHRGGGGYHSVDTNYVSSWVMKNADSAGKIYVDGVDLTDTNDYFSNKRIGYYTSIGGSYQGTASFYTGYIAQILIFDKAFTDIEREQIERYLANSAGVTI